MVRDLGWLGEKLGEFRYPPYNAKALGGIRSMLKNRQDAEWREMCDLPPRALPSLGWLRSLGLVLVGAAAGYSLSTA